MKKEYKDLYYLIPTAGMLLALFIITYFYSGNVLNSDISSELVLAKELLREHKLFSRNWFYSTEVRVIYTQLISVILLSFLDSWSLVRAVMNLICGILVIVSYCYMMEPLQLDKRLVYLSSVLLLIPFSTEYLLIVQMGNSYMPHYILCFTAIGLALRLFTEKTGKRNLFFFLLVLVGCGVSGIRYALILVLPLLATAFFVCGAERYREQKPVFHRELIADRRVKTALMGLLGYLAGYLVNVLYFGRYYTYEKYDTLYLSDFHTHGLSERLGTMAVDILRLFGYTDSAGIQSFTGIQSLVAIGFAAVLAYILFKVYSAVETEQGNRKFMKAFAVMSLFLNVMVFLFFDYMYEKRYFILVFLFFVPLLVMYFEECRRKPGELSRAVTVLFTAGCVLLCGLNLRYVAVSRENDEIKKVAAFLAENHADFGLATYWNGNILTELTDGEVSVVNIDELYFIEPYEWLMPSRFLERKTWEEEESENFFLLLYYMDLANMELEDNPCAFELLDKGEKVYDENGYMVFFYDKNTFIDTFAGYLCEDESAESVK